MPLTEKEEIVGGAGFREDQEFDYGHVKFEIPIGHPSGDSKFKVEFVSL